MSIEQAILDHAQAINNLASALSLLASNGAVNIGGGAARELEKAVSTANPAREAINEAPAAAKASNKKNDKSADAELEKAVGKVEADAKKNAGAADTATSTGANTAGSAKEQAAADLDYEKDVKPVLIALSMATDKQTMTDYVKSFGVDKAPQLPKEKFGEVIAGAKERTAKAEASKAA